MIKNPEQIPWRLHKEVGILQPATFIRRRLIEKIGVLRKDLNFCMDYEFWIRASKSGAKFKYLDQTLACARYYDENKTMGARDRSLREVIGMLKENFKYSHIDWIRRYAECLLYSKDGVLESVDSSETEAVEKIEELTSALVAKFNGDFHTTKFLTRNKDRVVSRTTKNALMAQKQNLPVSYCYRIPVETKTVPNHCLLYTSPSPRDQRGSRMPSSA